MCMNIFSVFWYTAIVLLTLGCHRSVFVLRLPCMSDIGQLSDGRATLARSSLRRATAFNTPILPFISPETYAVCMSPKNDC